MGPFGMVHIESEASLNWPSDGHVTWCVTWLHNYLDTCLMGCNIP